MGNFYALSLSERKALVRSAKEKQCTLMSRWESLNFEPIGAWSARAQVAATLLEGQTSVADIGCGMMPLEHFLELGVTYIPVDVVARDSRTIVVDLNVQDLPELGAHAIVGLGLLEYIYDVPRFLARLAATCTVVVLSYNPTDFFPDVSVDERLGNAWVNSFCVDELERLFANAGLLIEATIQFNATQTLWKLRCRK